MLPPKGHVGPICRALGHLDALFFAPRAGKGLNLTPNIQFLRRSGGAHMGLLNQTETPRSHCIQKEERKEAAVALVYKPYDQKAETPSGVYTI